MCSLSFKSAKYCFTLCNTSLSLIRLSFFYLHITEYYISLYLVFQVTFQEWNPLFSLHCRERINLSIKAFTLNSATIGGSYLDILTYNQGTWTYEGRELAARDMFYLQWPNCFWYRALIKSWIKIRIISFYLREDLDEVRGVGYND